MLTSGQLYEVSNGRYLGSELTLYPVEPMCDDSPLEIVNKRAARRGRQSL